MGSLSLLQGIFPAQESNRGFLHYRRILYQLSYQGSFRFHFIKKYWRDFYIGRSPIWTGLYKLIEKEMATHSSILAWKIPWTGEPGGLLSLGSQRIGHQWATNTHLETEEEVTLLCKFATWCGQFDMSCLSARTLTCILFGMEVEKTAIKIVTANPLELGNWSTSPVKPLHNS